MKKTSVKNIDVTITDQATVSCNAMYVQIRCIKIKLWKLHLYHNTGWQGWRDIRRSLVQPTAQSRVSFEVRMGYSGLYLVLKTLKYLRIRPLCSKWHLGRRLLGLGKRQDCPHISAFSWPCVNYHFMTILGRG